MRSHPLLCLLLAACSGPDGEDTAVDTDPCAPPGAPTLTIGKGYTGFEAIGEGEPFPLIHGPQGGFHLEIGLFSTNLNADDLITGVVTGTIDGEVWAESFPRLDMRCVKGAALGDGQESYGTLLVAFPGFLPDFLDGKTTTITATVTDLDGVEVSAESSFVIEDTE